jgi:molybdopterin-biosynthesis enzyme MoeA-like protein
MNFYALIIGSEILNGRRQDKHFSFIKDELQKRGHALYASFIVKDCPTLLENIFTLIKNDPDSVMFSFGGIGSTPDDLTREISAKVFADSKLVRHKQFEKDILERFKSEAYPHRIFMSDLPKDAKLLHNVVNNMSGYYLQDRYFFVPGFPQMAHPMIVEALDKFFPKNPDTHHRLTLLADTSENTLIDIMKLMSDDIEFSSLPMFVDNRPKVEISVSGKDILHVKESFDMFIEKLDSLNINYKLL